MILATRSGSREVREASVGAMLAAEGLTRGSGGTSVTAKTVGGIPAAKEAIRIAAEAVGKLELEVFRGTGVERRTVKTTWQSRLFARPNACDTQTWFEAKEGLEASLTGRNNGFWLKHKSAVGEVIGVELLHPDGVDGRLADDGTPQYRYRVKQGWSEWLTGSDVLHFRVGHVSPGSVFAPSPLELHREALRSILAKTKYESNLYENGILQSIAILLGEKVTAEQAERFRKTFEAEHGGLENQAKVRVIGGNSKVETIGLSLQDAQYVESMQLSVEAIANVYGVPSSLLGGGSKATGSAPLSPEHEQMRWLEYGLEPRLSRIVATVNSDADFFGPAARDYVTFTGVTVRADTASESRALVTQVQAGILLPDEARALKGLPPLADGVGQIPQLTPVGGAPNPNLDVPAEPDPGA